MNNILISESAPLLLEIDRDVDLAPGTVFGPIVRSAYIFDCNISGYGSVIINGLEFPVSPGDFYILLPGDRIIHTTANINPRRGIWCSLDGLSLGRILSSCGITATNPFAPKDMFPSLCRAMEGLYELRNDTDPGAELRRTSFLYSILGELARVGQKSDSIVPIRRAIGIMENYYNTSLDIEAIADSVGLARSYFSTLFKSVTGMSPHAYLNKLRIERFCTLIKNEDISISTAAEYVGLDPQNFSRIFRRETGKTPLEYKRSLQKK
ncbi:MAG: AraC family transcriptional regulator [Ruminococcaceae bacterium]|nr:AraC family transcriptional regulator [Oscillospiraceae bacterium]